MATFGRKKGGNKPRRGEAKNKGNEENKLTSRSKETGFSLSHQDSFKTFKALVYEGLMERIDLVAASQMTAERLGQEIEAFISEFAVEKEFQINIREQKKIAGDLLNDMIGLGPLEDITRDHSITDILVNGPHEVYIEREGKLKKIESIKFQDESHLQQIARRIASRVGRRIDESSPMVDARLGDGSRVNIIMPPLALDGTTVSIRKFSQTKFTLDMMVDIGTLSSSMAKFLKIVAACRLNVLISGGTGSGKTTLLNALSQLISPDERIITVEDSAELRLHQPHVVRLESRPPNIEGQGEVTIRDLVRNTLRMRPDRIIVGEVRGEETIDMLQAMNTGHDGSMSTIHANRPREALTRLENMMAMAGYEMPVRVIRGLIVGAINLIIHTERMRDGVRRITQISEITGIEEDTITAHDIFKFKYEEDVFDSKKGSSHIRGIFQPSGTVPNFIERARFYGLDKQLKEAIHKEGKNE